MPKSKELDEGKKASILVLLKEGFTEREVATKLSVSKTAVHYTKQKHKRFGTTKLQPGRGRKRLSSKRDDRSLIRSCLQNRRFTSSDLQKDWESTSNLVCSSRTIRNRLREAGIKSYRAKKKPFINERQRNKRLEFARMHKDWKAEDWAKVIFSDESNFQLLPTPGRLMVWRKPGEAYKPECLAPTVKHGGGSVMIWGCFSMAGTGRIRLCEGRMNQKTYKEVLEEDLLPSAKKLYPDNNDWIFQQDNAPCHTAKSVTTWMEKMNIRTMSWPAQSPDLNPIENLWNNIKEKMREHKPANKKELFHFLKQEWAEVTMEKCQHLIESMPRRMAATIKNKGYATKY